ncbi:hypothetical protein HDU76_004406 [Blyttiomyces sp. JEL0837]|nr:hypothetical protein HDU76_004406 [Blyttiomyces sp. JEL0837]
MTTEGVTLSFLLPPPPAAGARAQADHVHKRLSPPKRGVVEPVGEEFMAVHRRHSKNRTLSQDWELEMALRSEMDGDLNMDEDEPETEKLLASNPDNWKEQDHYAIMGISRLRWKATDDDIKKAYRRKVLKHHPDKKAGASGNTNDDSYFKCLQKAWEILSDNTKRRQWDSVDPEFDESLPGAKFKGDFFEAFGPAFEKEARFSKNPLAPFGDAKSTKEEVEAFYESWFNFDSWRSFEMMDEDEEGLGDSRDEKRYLEKKNRAARAKLKKEDNARIIKFVELAFKSDPRIQRIKEEEKYAKDAKKREKEAAAKAAAEEALRKAEEERLQKEQEEKEEKERREQEKKEKEAHKKLVRKAKKEIKAIFSGNNSFLLASASVSQLEEQLVKLESLMEGSELWHLEEFKERLESKVKAGVVALNACMDEEIQVMKERQESAAAKAAAAKSASASSAAIVVKKTKAPWTTKETTTLIKAVKTFPGGTVSRWEKIAEYVNLHGIEDGEAPGVRERGPEECIKKSKEMQDASVAERNAMQQAAAVKKKEVEIKETPTARDGEGAAKKENNPPDAAVNGKKPATPAPAAAAAPAPAAAGNSGFVIPDGDNSWTPAQQAALEAGLRKFPASMFSAAPSERWEKIASEIEGKNKKEVKQRVKDLADAIKKKNTKK